MSSRPAPARSTISSGSGATPSGSRSPTSRQPAPSAPDGCLRRAADALLALLLAPACAACRTPLDRPTGGAVCDPCWDAIEPLTPPFCAVCGDALPSWRVRSVAEARCARCRRFAPAVSLGRAIGPYAGSLRRIVHALKYDGRLSLAPRLAGLMRQSGLEVLAGADAVVPVPLHRRRQRERGFNQAAALARALGLPVLDCLWRRHATLPQADLPAARRHANVRGAFGVRAGRTVRGLTLVLVDDVSTTGATLDACARVLREAGAADVRALTAARAVSRSR